MNEVRTWGSWAESRAGRAGRLGVLGLIALLGVVLSLLLAHNQQAREQNRFENDFTLRATERKRAIEQEVRRAVETVESLATFYHASDRVEPREFEVFARSALAGRSSLDALSFDARVSLDERPAHEQAQHDRGVADYAIRDRAEDGTMVRAGDRPEYVVVTMVYPRESHDLALGFDVLPDPTRRAALERARDDAKPIITGRVRLVQDAGDGYGALIFVPIYTHGDPLTKERRRVALIGYAVGVLRFERIVEQALAGLPPIGIHSELVDESAPEGERLLYFRKSLEDPDVSIAQATEDFLAAGLTGSFPFEVAGRRWRLTEAPTEAYATAGRTWLPAGLLGMGLLTTCLIVGYLAWQSSMTRRLREAMADRERAEQREAGLGRMIEQSHDEIYVVDQATLQFVFVNRGALNNLGYSMDEMRRMTPLDIKPDGTQDEFEDRFAPLRDGSQTMLRFVSRHRRKDGSTYDVEVHLQGSTFDGGPVFVASIIDITDRLRLEERLRQTQRLEALGTLAGGIAHDFNNLLTAIHGYTELALADLPPDSPVREHLDEVRKAGQRARDVVRRILAFSRRTSFVQDRCDLENLIGEVQRLVRASLPSSIEIRTEIDGPCPTQGDPTQIHQVLMNLCTNAAHAMGSDGGTLTLGLDRVALGPDEAKRLGDLRPGPYARIRVRDTGVGIPSDLVERIFDPFFTTKNPDEGTGMGLSVSHGIVAAHGGAIDVSSRVGKGSTFEVYLPIDEATPATSADERGTDAEETVEGDGASILVVEDEEANCRLLRTMLEREGYEVEAFTDAVQALAAARARAGGFDLVITDHTMPRMSGAELARQLRELDADLPVIMVSGYGELLDEAHLRVSGVDTLLSKPIQFPELMAAMRRVLAARGAARNR